MIKIAFGVFLGLVLFCTMPFWLVLFALAPTAMTLFLVLAVLVPVCFKLDQRISRRRLADRVPRIALRYCDHCGTAWDRDRWHSCPVCLEKTISGH